MNPKRSTALLFSLALVLVACQTPPVTSGTTAAPAITTPSDDTSDAPSVKTVDEVACDSAPEEVEIVCEAYQLIQIHYVDDISDEDLASAALESLESVAPNSGGGEIVCAVPADAFVETCRAAATFDGTSAEAAEAMVVGLANHALDPNSVYFDEAALKLLEQEQEGQIEGIGALVSPEDETLESESKQCTVVSDTCRILIVSTIEGAPAEAAGLLRNDVIVGVNGESITGWTIDEVTSLVRGPAGTDVTLSIDRGGESLEIPITRAAVEIPVIDVETVGNTGYVRLRIFSQNADEQFEDAVVDQLANGVDSLVIDLRDNPGGLLDTAIAIASVFLPDGDVVVTQSPDEDTSYPASGASIIPSDFETIFLVNKGSASASEVVSAVLQERGLATVVGINTFGKNTVQQRFPLSNGGALKLTIARWLTPGGLDFGGVGVTPDVDMDLDNLDVEALVEAALSAA